MRNLIEKLLADGGEYLYIVRRPGETAVGVESGPALLRACYNTEDIGRAGMSRMSTEAVLTAYMKAKHGGSHE